MQKKNKTAIKNNKETLKNDWKKMKKKTGKATPTETSRLAKLLKALEDGMENNAETKTRGVLLVASMVFSCAVTPS